MKRFHGFSADTPKRILCDVGALFLNYDFAKSYKENVDAGKRIGAIQDGTGSVDSAVKTSTSSE